MSLCGEFSAQRLAITLNLIQIITRLGRGLASKQRSIANRGAGEIKRILKRVMQPRSTHLSRVCRPAHPASPPHAHAAYRGWFQLLPRKRLLPRRNCPRREGRGLTPCLLRGLCARLAPPAEELGTVEIRRPFRDGWCKKVVGSPVVGEPTTLPLVPASSVYLCATLFSQESLLDRTSCAGSRRGLLLWIQQIRQQS